MENMMNPFQNFKANPDVLIPNYNELNGIHKVQVKKVTITWDNVNMSNSFEDTSRDWSDPNPMVLIQFGNASGTHFHRSYYYGYMKWDELRLNPMYNQRMDLFKPSNAMSTKPYAIYCGDSPVEVVLFDDPVAPEKYILQPGSRVPCPKLTTAARTLYSIVCKACGVPGCSDPMELVDKECWIEVKQVWFSGKKYHKLVRIDAEPFNDAPKAAIVVSPIAQPKSLTQSLTDLLNEEIGK